MIGQKRVEQSACRWLKAYNNHGTIRLRDIILKAFNKRGYKKGSRSIKMAYLSTIKDASTNEILAYHLSE